MFVSDFHRELLITISKIYHTTQEIEKRLKFIEDSLKAKELHLPGAQNNGHGADEDALEAMLPLGTLLEFDEFDNKLREKEFASRVVRESVIIWKLYSFYKISPAQIIVFQERKCPNSLKNCQQYLL